MANNPEVCGLKYLGPEISIKKGGINMALFYADPVSLCYGCDKCGLSAQVRYGRSGRVWPDEQKLQSAIKEELEKDAESPEGIIVLGRARIILEKCPRLNRGGAPKGARV